MGAGVGLLGIEHTCHSFSTEINLFCYSLNGDKFLKHKLFYNIESSFTKNLFNTSFYGRCPEGIGCHNVKMSFCHSVLSHFLGL